MDKNWKDTPEYWRGFLDGYLQAIEDFDIEVE